MKKARLWLVLVLLAPVLTVAQEKYTNADLKKLTPRQDAYTNADLNRLAPLPIQARPIVAIKRVSRDVYAEEVQARAARRAAQLLNRDLLLAEIDYWEDLIVAAHGAWNNGPNGYPHVGGESGEARARLQILRRVLHMIDAEISLER